MQSSLFLLTITTQFLQLELKLYLYDMIIFILHFLSSLSNRNKISQCVFWTQLFSLSVTSGKIGCLIWVSGGMRCLFLIKNGLNWGICTISFRKKKSVKPGLCWLKPFYPGTSYYIEDCRISELISYQYELWWCSTKKQNRFDSLLLQNFKYT